MIRPDHQIFNDTDHKLPQRGAKVGFSRPLPAERTGAGLCSQTEDIGSLVHTDGQRWARSSGASSLTYSPTRPPSRWWWRAGLWASSTGSYSCSSSRTSLGQSMRLHEFGVIMGFFRFFFYMWFWFLPSVDFECVFFLFFYLTRREAKLTLLYLTLNQFFFFLLTGFIKIFKYWI